MSKAAPAHPTREQESAAGAGLQQLLVAVLDLGLLVKQAHWNLHGPGFRATYLHLDEIADALRGHSDSLAERAVSIGTPADGRAETIAAHTPLTSLPAGPLQTREVVSALAERLDDVADVGRELISTLDDLDLISQDLAIEVVATLEQHRWLLRAEL